MPKLIYHKYKGGRYTVGQISKLFNPLKIPYSTLNSRINRDGWDIEKALLTPAQHITQAQPTKEWKRLGTKERSYNLELI